MTRFLGFLLVFGALGAGVYFYLLGGQGFSPRTSAGRDPGEQGLAQAAPQQGAAPAPAAGAAAQPATVQTRQRVVTPLVVIPDGRLSAIHVQQIPALRDGKILFLATEARELKPTDPKPAGKESDYFTEEMTQVVVQRTGKEGQAPDELLMLPIDDGKESRLYSPLRKGDVVKPKEVRQHLRKVVFHRLREGAEVRRGDLVAVIDPILASEEVSINVAKLEQAEADREASLKTQNETYQRWLTADQLYARKAIPQEEWRAARLTYDRYVFETISKEKQVISAGMEVRKASTILELHQVKADIGGTVKTLLKKPGESVKNLDPVMIIQDNKRLRIEGRMDYFQRRHIKVGDRLPVEPSQSVSPDQALVGHLQTVTGVAVSKAGEIVSVSEDKTARVWDRKAEQERLVLTHPSRVRSVACSPKDNLCVTGTDDGIVRLWDLGAETNAPRQEMKDGHKGVIHSVAFSPDGTLIASGGDDRSLCVWQVESGKRLAQIQGHGGSVTMVQFVSVAGQGGPRLYLVSAGRDYAMFVWEVSADGSLTNRQSLGQRTGDVTSPGANATTGQVLFDQGRELRIRSLPDGRLGGVLTSASGSNFTTMALFSPDGNLILTAGGSDGRLQLWRAPTATTRGYELRQLAWTGDMVTCGAFSPDGSFVVTGTKDRGVLVWPVPSKLEVEMQHTAEVTLVDHDLDLNSRQIRIHAEIDNCWFELTPQSFAWLRGEPVPGVNMEAVTKRLEEVAGREFAVRSEFEKAASARFNAEDWAKVRDAVIRAAEKPGPLLPGNTATLVVYPKTR